MVNDPSEVVFASFTEALSTAGRVVLMEQLDKAKQDIIII